MNNLPDGGSRRFGSQHFFACLAGLHMRRGGLKLRQENGGASIIARGIGFKRIIVVGCSD